MTYDAEKFEFFELILLIIYLFPQSQVGRYRGHFRQANNSLMKRMSRIFSLLKNGISVHRSFSLMIGQ